MRLRWQSKCGMPCVLKQRSEAPLTCSSLAESGVGENQFVHELISRRTPRTGLNFIHFLHAESEC